jgi:hypothetical protein
MRNGLVCTAIVLSFVLAPMASLADDVQNQLQRMEDRMAEMEDRLQATNDQLEAANDVVTRQQEVIDRSGIADQTAGSSGVAAFLDSLELGGWLAGSYFYNFNDPNGEGIAGANQGISGFQYPFHPDHDSFSVDQLWFEMERPVTESNRAGFRADLCYGKTCDILSNGGSGDYHSGSSNDFNLYQAYVQYLAPVGEGVTFKFGKFGTLIGAEVAPTVYNMNVTRGHVYNLLQPITQVGLLAEMEFGDGFHGALGYINENVTANDTDLNLDQAFTGQLGWSGETLGVNLSGTYGSTNGALNNELTGTTAFLGNNTPSQAGNGAFNTPCDPSTTICSLESDKETIADLVITWDPTPEFSAWLNATYREVELSQSKALINTATGQGASVFGSDVAAWGVAVAGRYAINDKLGFAMRAEYLDDEDGFFTGLAFSGAGGCESVPSDGNASGFCGVAGKNVQLISLTGTMDYSLTEQLMVRGEVRYDQADLDRVSDRVFFGDGNRAEDFENDQITAGVEVIYNF